MAAEPSSHEIEQKVKAIVQEMFNLEPDRLNAETELVHCDRGMIEGFPTNSSLEWPWVTEEDMAELAMRLEEAFDITIPARELDAVRTIGDVIELVKRHVRRAGAS